MKGPSNASEGALKLLDQTGGTMGVEDDRSSAHNGSSKDLEQSSNRESDSNVGSHTGSSRTGTGTGTEEDANDIRNAMAREETKQVFRLRVIVLVVLFLLACAISYTIYHITHEAEIEEFENEFEAVAATILTRLNDIVVEMSAVAGLAVTVSAEANSTFPFMTLQAFQERATNVRFLSGLTYLTINPIVRGTEELAEWENYVQSDANSWIAEALTAQDEKGLNDFDNPIYSRNSFLTNQVVDPLHTFTEDGKPLPSQSSGPMYVPSWQTSPVLETSMVNRNLLEKDEVAELLMTTIDTRSAVLGGFNFAPAGKSTDADATTAFYATLESIFAGKEVPYLGDPMSHLAFPIFDSIDRDNRGEVVAILKATLHWQYYLKNILPDTDYGYLVVIQNSCDDTSTNAFTYQVDGPDAKVLGFGDRHDRKFSQYQEEGYFSKSNIQDGTADGLPFDQSSCPYSFKVYPTQDDYDHYVTYFPLIISLCIAGVFAFTIATFIFYDRLVERRQRIVLAKATQSTAIVSSLFPKQVRDRLLAVEDEKQDRRKGDAMVTNNHKIKSFLQGGDQSGRGDMQTNEQPIADLFPHCTVMFADIAGFTAWSSAREPAQVFILLQTVYQNFDAIAKRRRVFKVETIGDSYLAVTGLPEPQSKHASIMARFAWDCLLRFGEVTKELESSLGPDTTSLSMRVGLHSGPVTAGVLKGDRARFQLFGDTVNTAARMESTGTKGRIQVSEATAEALKKEHKGSWLTAREDAVSAKGKGVLTTYWVALKNSSGPSVGTRSTDNDTLTASERSAVSEADMLLDLKESRLVEWTSEMLLRQIKKVVAVHKKCPLPKSSSDKVVWFQPENGKICLDEVQDAISTPDFNADVAEAALEYHQVKVPLVIIQQVREYVTMIAESYRSKNPFHGFEHACHVTMSVAKLLGRVVTPDLAPVDTPNNGQSSAFNNRETRQAMAAQIHDFTHGLTSDPLANLALVFAALIHDVDHQGISNVQLSMEEPELHQHYRGKSVAEQNSLDIAWDMLMSNQFQGMREYIFETSEELCRFRQLIVNMVLATDIFDKELNQLRKDRWQRAFSETSHLPATVTKDLRATIVMEHIIQASDVAHTMQHWHIYQKWNRRLLEEMYGAYKAGRMPNDPRTFWYKGELGFFDNYVIPLAKKLKECNVFGVSSDEYLGYALKNRAEWEERGEEIVQQTIDELD